jgi:hypothetical protein
MRWDHVNLLHTEAMRSMADVLNAAIVLSDAEIHTMRLVHVGGFYVGDINATFWAVDTGDPGDLAHEVTCPVCRPAPGLIAPDDDVPF